MFKVNKCLPVAVTGNLLMTVFNEMNCRDRIGGSLSTVTENTSFNITKKTKAVVPERK